MKRLTLPRLSDQGVQFLHNLVMRLGGQLALELRFSRLPVEAFYLVGKYHSAYAEPFRYHDLKGISFDLAGDGAKDSQAHFSVIGSG